MSLVLQLQAGDAPAIILGTGIAVTVGVTVDRQVTAGAGMTGGGTLAADITLDVVAADATIVVNANSIQLGIVEPTNLPFSTVENVLATADDSVGVNAQRIVDVADPVDPQDAATKAYADSLDIGDVTEDGHPALRQLIHFLDEGPGEGFASGAYREALPTSNPFPTSITWWTSAAKTNKIVEETIVYNLNKTIATDAWKVYDSGGALLATVTDTYSYSGVFETSRTRAIV